MEFGVFMVLVSVVIPVYNVEQYLEECLESVTNQTLRDIEIICIDDGSEDNSLEILEKYEKLDDRIKVVSQENKGPGATRNLGINISKGKYLYFIDSDDYIELNALEELFNYAKEKDVDFLLYPAINLDNQNKRFFKTDIYSMNDVEKFIGDGVVDYKDLDNLIFSIPVTAYSKLYNADFIKKNDIKFPEGLIFEDNIFFWNLVFSAKKIAFYSKYFYIRRRHSSSITTLHDKRLIDSIEINRLMVETFKKFGILDKFKNVIYNRRINLTYLRFVEILDEYKEDYYKKLNQDYKNIVNDGYYDDYINILDSRNKAIFEICLNSNTYKEFRYEMAYWDSRNTNKNLQNKINGLNNDIGDFKNKINSLNDENTRFKEDIAVLKNENNGFKENIDILRDENSNLNENIQLLENVNSSLKKDLKKFINQNNSFKEDIRVLSDENLGFKEDIRVLSDENLGFKEEIQDLKKENSNLNENISLLNDEKIHLNKEIDDLNLLNNNLNDENQKLIKDIKYEKIKNISLKDRIKFLKEET